MSKFDEVYPESISQISQALDMLQKKVVREKLLNDNQRVDGRGLMDLRPLYAEVGILPRTHGLDCSKEVRLRFLQMLPLGPLGDVQMLDGVAEEETKGICIIIISLIQRR